MSLSVIFGILVLFLLGLGLNALSISPRIIDGESARILDFPYLVSIQNYYGTNHHCGGIIIDPYHVLTAAHCIDGFEPEDFRIVSGTEEWKKPGSIHYVSDIISHEKLSIGDTWHNDIGLIKVMMPFIFGPSTNAARLPAENAEPIVNATGIAIGFGRTREYSGPSETLLKTELVVRDISYCNEIYKKNHFKKTQICAQGENNATIYKGDSGGPFIVDGTVVGITLTGMPSRPSAFTKISKYIDWINTHKKDASCIFKKLLIFFL